MSRTQTRHCLCISSCTSGEARQRHKKLGITKWHRPANLKGVEGDLLDDLPASCFSLLSPPQHWSRLSMRVITVALFQKEIFQMSTVLENVELNTASNGWAWHYIGLIKSGSDIPPPHASVNSSIFPLTVFVHHFTVGTCRAGVWHGWASSKFFPLIPILSGDH